MFILYLHLRYLRKTAQKDINIAEFTPMKIGYETAMLKLVCSKVSQAFKMQVIKKA